jgi:4-hydroxybenzoyl-CoA reductase subunit beta
MGTLGGNICLDTRCNYYDQNYEWRQAIGFCMKKEGNVCWVAPSSDLAWRSRPPTPPDADRARRQE